jgi:8-oxo-dGTP diphosphatase
MSDALIIHIAAAILMRADGATLLVRKRGTTAFMQPGGKIDAEELPVEALCRELSEELDLMIAPADTIYLGRFCAPAANESGWTVEAEMFRIVTEQIPRAMAEIEEIGWILPDAPIRLELAPLTRDHVLPLIGQWRAQNG